MRAKKLIVAVHMAFTYIYMYDGIGPRGDHMICTCLSVRPCDHHAVILSSLLAMDRYKDEMARIVSEGDSYYAVSQYLGRAMPSRRGLSARSVRQFCSSRGIHYRSRLDSPSLDRTIHSRISFASHSYGRRSLQGLLRSDGINVSQRRIGSSLAPCFLEQALQEPLRWTDLSISFHTWLLTMARSYIPFHTRLLTMARSYIPFHTRLLTMARSYIPFHTRLLTMARSYIPFHTRLLTMARSYIPTIMKIKYVCME